MKSWAGNFSLIIIGLYLVTALQPVYAQNSLAQQHPLYGMSLFNFYQEKYFSAITDLMVADQRQQLIGKDDNAALLLGGLYYYYGMPGIAEKLFRKHMENMQQPYARDRIWFNLGKMQYSAGNLDASERLLKQYHGTLEDDNDAERLTLLGNIYLKNSQYTQAQQILPKLHDVPVWQAYAFFNNGVVLAKQGEIHKAQQMLSKVRQIESSNAEVKALKDKASLALAYSYLRNRQIPEAIKAFNQIRLKGPLSNKALLGYGWAFYQAGNYDRALISWNELKKRKHYDNAVQESLLAIPYTHEKMQQPAQALENYQFAIDSYTGQSRKISFILQQAKNGSMLEYLRPSISREDSFLPRYARIIPDNISGPYLQHVFAQSDFQNAHRTYHQLLHLDARFDEWRKQLPALRLMLHERNRSYNSKKKTIHPENYSTRINRLEKKYTQLHTKYQRIIETNDYLSLANADEYKQLSRLKRIAFSLRGKSGEEVTDQLEKHRIMTGLLRWQIDNEYPERIWRIKKSLLQLRQVLSALRKNDTALKSAWKKAPDNFTGFTGRLSQLEQKITLLQAKNRKLIQRHEQKLLAIIQQHLEQQATQLNQYHLRARYAHARLYDSLANQAGEQQ